MWSDELADNFYAEKDFKVCLEVSGIYFFTLKSTLRKCPYFDSLDITHDGCLFIDRDPSYFSYILNFLRNGELNIICEERGVINQLKCEAKFFGLTNLVKILDKTPSYSMLDIPKYSRVRYTLDAAEEAALNLIKNYEKIFMS